MPDRDSTPTAPPEKRRRLERVIAACDLCKARKVKCNGELPCSYCKRKNRADTCSFSAPKQRVIGLPKSAGHTPNDPGEPPAHGSLEGERRSKPRRHSDDAFARPRTNVGSIDVGADLSPTVSREEHQQEDTVVPLEGRILRDAQGKVIFIGDCAPLSFLQTVRHLIASEVDADGFPVTVSRDSVIEVAKPQSSDQSSSHHVNIHDVEPLLQAYFTATSGLVDLFDRMHLTRDVKTWASDKASPSDDATTAVYYLITAIGSQESDEQRAETWFNHARDVLLKNLCGSMNVATVQGFSLVAVYMLRAFQPNGAYLYFSLAARTAYAIGLHRTEVNASFGESVCVTRDRIWKSLRVVDMLISNVLGRPPSTSDVDCTVKYRVADVSNANIHVLDASVQIFMIIERVVVEVYSRKRISLKIAGYVSHQLKSWASNWHGFLLLRVRSSLREEVVGACSTLCSYYYSIMLLTRPFLIYELYEYLGASLKATGTQTEHQEKRKYADAALEAAASFVETLQAVIASENMPLRMPLVVSWLFTTSLVLAVGVLGSSGLSFEDDCKASIRCLDHFGRADPHARQYSLIVQALLETTTAFVRKRERKLRSERKQASSQLFGLLPLESNSAPPNPTVDLNTAPMPQRSSFTPFEHDSSGHSATANVPPAPADWTMYDADFFALPWMTDNDQGLQDFLQPGRHTLDGENLADIPLFPIYDQVGGGFL